LIVQSVWLFAAGEAVYDEKIITLQELTLPRYFDFDGQYFFISDEFEKAVFQIDLHGQVIQRIENPDNLIFFPVGVSYQFPFIYLTDSSNNQLLRIKKEQAGYFQESNVLLDNLNGPTALTRDIYGNLYLLEKDSNRVLKLDSNGQLILKFGRFGYTQETLRDPYALAVDNAQNIYIADNGRKRIKVFDNRGQFIYSFKEEFEDIRGITVDEQGYLYVCDLGNSCIKVFKERQLVSRVDLVADKMIFPIDIKAFGESIFILDDTKRIFVVKRTRFVLD